MPAQKRPPPPDDHRPVADGKDDDDDGSPPPPSFSNSSPHQKQQEEQPPQPPQERKQDDSDDGDEDGGSHSSSCTATADKDGFILVKLADMRNEVRCPICLGIIRKTRTVMECLHRFCRECIDKSMRLGNNECPACRTHCASRRSLRDDPNYDSLIAILYPDINKYEEEELAFHEEEKTHNMMIQASIAETFQRQTEALGRRRSTAKASAVAFMTRSHGNFRNSHLKGRRYVGRDIELAWSDNDDEDANGNDGGKDSSSGDETSSYVRQKRCKRSTAAWLLPSAANVDGGCDENDDMELGSEILGAYPGRGNREVLVWGKGGARSQTRRGGTGGTNSKNFRGNRVNKLVEYLPNVEENNELDVNLTLLPLDEQTMPSLQRPFICCPLTLSIRHLHQFIATQISVQAEEVEILFRKPRERTSVVKPSTSVEEPIHDAHFDPQEDEELQILGAQECLVGLCAHFSSHGENLFFVYRSKIQS